MAKQKRKLTAAEKAARKRRRRDTEIVFINGKQKRVRRSPKIEGMDSEEWIRRNADPIWLHQNERWDEMTPDESAGDADEESPSSEGEGEVSSQ